MTAAKMTAVDRSKMTRADRLAYERERTLAFAAERYPGDLEFRTEMLEGLAEAEAAPYYGPEFLPECPAWCDFFASDHHETHDYLLADSDPECRRMVREHTIETKGGWLFVAQEEFYEDGRVTFGPVIVGGVSDAYRAVADAPRSSDRLSPAQARQVAANIVAAAQAAEAVRA